MLTPYQKNPNAQELFIEEKQVNTSADSLAEGAFLKSVQEEFIYDQLGARVIKEKLDSFLWKEKQHVKVKELLDWCKKYIYLPRVTSDEVILNALQNANAALSGEETFYLSDGYDDLNNSYEGLRPQFKSLTKPTADTYIVKTKIAEAQQQENNHDNLTSNIKDIQINSSHVSDDQNQETSPSQTSITKYKNYRATLKLNPQTATLDFGKFMVEVMSHLQDLPGKQEIDLTLEIDAKIDTGIDQETARIILENSRELKVDGPEIS